MTSPPPDDSALGAKGAGPEAQDIYSRAWECEALFARCLETPSKHSAEIFACHRRFLSWASILDVFADESASLDRRLEFSPDMRELVMSMLRILQKDLERGMYY